MPKIISEIPKKFEGKFPKGFDNRIRYWGFFTRSEIEQNKGRLLMLDIDFGRYCSLDCSSCFRKSNVVDDIPEGDLNYKDLLKVIDEARELGLQSVKICGAGEPTQHSRFLEFVRDMTNRDVGVATFTKGQVLGSDEETERFYEKRYGIKTAKDLAKELYGLKTSFMLGFQSFDTEKEDQLVRKQGHALVRNRALENLVDVGFNNEIPTRLALVDAPITKANYDEAFEIYIFARERNIYPVMAVLMVSGKQIDKKFLEENDLTEDQKLDLWTKVYGWNIQTGLQTLDEIREQRVSVMPGGHPCNQVACGLYVTAKGNVVGCPGFGELGDIEGNVKHKSVEEIWQNSENMRRRAGTYNCHCPPKDGITIPPNLYNKVLGLLGSL